jgi:hypothetical protein
MSRWTQLFRRRISTSPKGRRYAKQDPVRVASRSLLASRREEKGTLNARSLRRRGLSDCGASRIEAHCELLLRRPCKSFCLPCKSFCLDV